MLEMADSIPEDVRRFILTSVPTVPHLETLLILWREPDKSWLVEQLAARIYVQVTTVQSLLDDLCEAELLECGGEPRLYRSRREPASLAELISAVDRTYARQLREVAELIHSNVDRKAARFAQAFSWRKH